MPTYDQELVDRILAATDIVALVGSVVPLTKRSGDNLFGRCPFHKEKTASFSVNRRKQIFHCFGCGVGGDAIGWLMRYEKINFPEAVRRLAEQAKIDLPRYRPSGEDSLNESLFRLHEVAQKLFLERLRDSSNTKAQSAMDYLLGRGLTPETIDSCGIGLAPDSWDTFALLAMREGFRIEQLLGSGLCGRNDSGNVYDRFRDRITFPIQNLSNRIVGFGARVLPGKDDGAKYLNSPETAIYKKSEILYGLPWARDEIRKQDSVIVVEGYLDLISLHQFGVQNVVATSGTALTNRQARLLHRFSPKVFLVYDGDEAGRRASLRGGDVMIAEGLDVHVAFLPEGEDPDTYVQKFGAEAFHGLLLQGQGWLEHQYAHFVRLGALNSPSDTVAALRELIRVLREMSDSTIQNFWVKRIAQRFQIAESVVRHELSRGTIATRNDDDETVDTQTEWNEDEAQIIAFLVKYRETPEDFEYHKRIHRWLKPDIFTTPPLRALYDLFVRKWLEENEFPEISDLIATAKLFPQLEDWVNSVLMQKLSKIPHQPNPSVIDEIDFFEHDLAMTEEKIRVLMVPVYERQIEEIEFKIVRASQQELPELFQSKHQVNRIIKQLQKTGFLAISTSDL